MQAGRQRGSKEGREGEASKEERKKEARKGGSKEGRQGDTARRQLSCPPPPCGPPWGPPGWYICCWYICGGPPVGLGIPALRLLACLAGCLAAWTRWLPGRVGCLDALAAWTHWLAGCLPVLLPWLSGFPVSWMLRHTHVAHHHVLLIHHLWRTSGGDVVEGCPSIGSDEKI